MRALLTAFLFLISATFYGQAYQIVITATNAAGSATDTIAITLAASPAPVIESIEVGDIDNVTVVVLFTESTLDQTSVPVAGDFVFKVDGSATGYGLSNFAFGAGQILFDIATPIVAFEELTLDYVQDNLIRGPTNRVDVPYTGTFTGANLVYTADVVGGGGLPAGLTFNSSTLTFTWNGPTNAVLSFTDQGVTNSLDGPAMIANLPDLPLPIWLNSGYLDVFDSLSAEGVIAHSEYFLDTQSNTEPNSKEDMRGSIAATEVGTLIWNQYTGFISDTTNALDLNYQYGGSGENITYILKGTALSNDLNENVLLGADDGTQGFELTHDTDNNNWAAHIHGGNKFGNFFTIDTTDFIAVARYASDSVKIFKSDSLIQRKLKTYVGKPAVDLYLLGLNKSGVLTDAAIAVTGYAIVGDTVLTEKLSQIHRAIFKLDSIKKVNGPSTDTEAPTPPVITPATASSITHNGAQLNLTSRGTDNIGVVKINWFTAQRGFEGITTSDSLLINVAPSTLYQYYAAGEDLQGNVSINSDTVSFLSSAAPGGVITYSEDFELPNTCSGCPAKNFGEMTLDGGTNRATIITDPTDGGNRVVEFDISRPVSEYSSTNSRSEIWYRCDDCPQSATTFPQFLPWGQEISWQYRFYLPTEWDWDAGHQVIIQQIHGPQGLAVSNPPASLRIKDQHLVLSMRWQPDSVLAQTVDVKESSSYESSSGCTSCEMEFSLSKSTWYYVVIDMTYDYRNTAGSAPLGGGSGIYKVYIKAGNQPTVTDLLFNHVDGTGYNSMLSSGLSNFLKTGIYRWQWRNQSHIDIDDALNIDRSRMFLDDLLLKDSHEF